MAVEKDSDSRRGGAATFMRGADARFAGFFLLALVDLASLWAGCLVAFELAGRQEDRVPGFVVLSLTYLAIGALAGTFSRRALLSPTVSIGTAAKAAIFSIAAVWAVASLSRLWDSSNSGGVALAAAVVAVLIAAGRISLAVLSNLAAASFSTDLLIVDDLEPSVVPANYSVINARELGIGKEAQISAIGFSRLTRLAGKADRILISCSMPRSRFWSEVCDALGLDAAVIVTGLAREGMFDSEFETDLPILRINRGPLSLRQRIHKRLFDLAIAVPVFIVLTPVFAVIWIALAATLKRRKVIQTCDILGLRNQPFRLVWFASEPSTIIGRALDRSRLAKGPALLAVVLGRMSMIGPAPVEAGSHTNEAKRLRNLKPGLFRPSTGGAGSSYREGWTVWRDVVSLARFDLWRWPD